MPATESKAAKLQRKSDAEALKPCSWDRLPDETADQFYWFKVFRDFGPGRRTQDVIALYNNRIDTIGGSNQVYNWAAKFNWRQRASAYDDWCAERVKEGAANALRIQGEMLESNRRVFKSKEIFLADLAFDKVRQLLSMPVATDTWMETKDGKTVLHKRTLVQPSHYFAAAALFKVASAIGRQALGIANQDESEITPEQFRELFYKHAAQVAEALPVGALPPPPAQTAAKPIIALEDATHPDMQSAQDRQNKAYRPPRDRPYEHNGGNGNGD